MVGGKYVLPAGQSQLPVGRVSAAPRSMPRSGTPQNSAQTTNIFQIERLMAFIHSERIASAMGIRPARREGSQPATNAANTIQNGVNKTVAQGR